MNDTHDAHRNLFDHLSQMQQLQVQTPNGEATAQIKEVKPVNSHSPGKTSFAMLLSIVDSPVDSQGIVHISGEGLDAMPVFMVPVNQIDNALHFEVLFN